jgi:hypothetical protein
LTNSIDYLNRGFHLNYHQLPCSTNRLWFDKSFDTMKAYLCSYFFVIHIVNSANLYFCMFCV